MTLLISSGQRVLLNFPYLANLAVYLTFFVLGGIFLSPVAIIAYKAFSRKLLPDAVKARKADRKKNKETEARMIRMKAAMDKQCALIRETGYQLDEIRRAMEWDEFEV